MASMDKLAKELKTLINDSDNRKPKPFDTQAEVVKVDGETAWVHIPGGVESTPVKLTTNAKKGDMVQVRIANGSGWIVGNVTAPPTDDTKAYEAISLSDEAFKEARRARSAADSAEAEAIRAVEAANEATSAAAIADSKATAASTAAASAQSSADAASQAAATADSKATAASTAAASAQSSADAASQAAATADSKATAASTAADAASQAAATADSKATAANDSAKDAKNYADNALTQLGVVEDVVGVLELLQKNGDYQITQDEEVQGGKWYFSRSGTSPNFVYSVVNNPESVYHLSEDTSVESGKTYYTRSGSGTEEAPYVYTEVDSPSGSPVTQGWYEKYYELVGIDEAIQNYVTSQLAVDDQGLWLKRPDSTGIQTKVLLSSTDGVVLYGANGQVVGKYGETAQIGDSAGFHIEIDGTELGFYQAENKVAYINNNQLYITQSVVLQQMDLGMLYDGITGFGQWSWKVHKNGDNPPRNNLNLKWVG